MTLNTLDMRVPPQIEAVKSYLRAEGFADVEDGTLLQSRHLEGVHVIVARFNGASSFECDVLSVVEQEL